MRHEPCSSFLDHVKHQNPSAWSNSEAKETLQTPKETCAGVEENQKPQPSL